MSSKNLAKGFATKNRLTNGDYYLFLNFNIFKIRLKEAHGAKNNKMLRFKYLDHRNYFIFILILNMKMIRYFNERYST